MEAIIFICVLAFVFFIGLLFPTILYLSDEKKKKPESILPYVLVSLFYVLVATIFVLLYKTSAIEKDTICSNVLNFNCVFSNVMPKRIEPNFNIYLTIFVQLFGMVLYAFYTAKTVMHFTSKGRVYIELIIFFLVSVVSSIVHYLILFDAVFIGGAEYVTLFSANQYGVLPMIYLLFMTYMNRDQLKIK